MNRIRLLSHAVITQIAAGEVIERPASVVKELLENSVDAGATRIDIDLEAGGTELIRVADDGHGIHANDLPLTFAVHATSKLATADDLTRINTLGFRGEALASIGGVAQVGIWSRRAGEGGAEIHCNGGELADARPWGGPVGTRIEVRHLFCSVPVRKKFLKSQATELGHVCEVVTRLALARPTLHLTLKHNGKLVYEVPASASLPDRIGLFFGADIREALYQLDPLPGPYRLTGYVADPSCDRGNAKLQYLFVNGRWFRDRSLGHALQEAYRNLLMVGRYAVGFLFLEVPPDSVDVNVHPTKAEVRFRENSVLYSLVRATVKGRLLRENLVPQLTVPAATEPVPEPELPEFPEPRFPEMLPPREVTPRFNDDMPSPRRAEAERTAAPWEVPPAPVVAQTTPVAPMQAPVATPSTPVADAPGSPQALGPPSLMALAFATLPAGAAMQVHDAYLVMETPGGMLVIDQHALHERILFEQLRRRIRDGKLEVQRLLIPEPIDLPPEQAAAVLDAREALAELGLEVSEFGGNTILLSSYPTLLKRRPPGEVLQGVIDYLVAQDRPPAKEVLLDHLLATMACKAAVKAGDKLTAEEITHLLRLRDFAEDSSHCPHGRPTSLLFSRQELDRQFRRI